MLLSSFLINKGLWMLNMPREINLKQVLLC